MGRRKKGDTQSLASLEKAARASLADTIAALRSQNDKVRAILDAALSNPERLDSKLVRDMTVTQGINVDKTKDILRALRDLESATDEELEAAFDVYEQDPDTGERVLVSKVGR